MKYYWVSSTCGRSMLHSPRCWVPGSQPACIHSNTSWPEVEHGLVQLLKASRRKGDGLPCTRGSRKKEHPRRLRIPPHGQHRPEELQADRPLGSMAALTVAGVFPLRLSSLKGTESTQTRGGLHRPDGGKKGSRLQWRGSHPWSQGFRTKTTRCSPQVHAG